MEGRGKAHVHPHPNPPPSRGRGIIFGNDFKKTLGGKKPRIFL
jgi:hypothetical protein